MGKILRNDFKPTKIGYRCLELGNSGGQTLTFHKCDNGGLNITVEREGSGGIPQVYFTVNPEDQVEFLDSLETIFDEAGRGR